MKTLFSSTYHSLYISIFLSLSLPPSLSLPLSLSLSLSFSLSFCLTVCLSHSFSFLLTNSLLHYLYHHLSLSFHSFLSYPPACSPVTIRLHTYIRPREHSSAVRSPRLYCWWLSAYRAQQPDRFHDRPQARPILLPLHERCQR